MGNLKDGNKGSLDVKICFFSILYLYRRLLFKGITQLDTQAILHNIKSILVSQYNK
jgi:hypothetical protein